MDDGVAVDVVDSGIGQCRSGSDFGGHIGRCWETDTTRCGAADFARVFHEHNHQGVFERIRRRLKIRLVRRAEFGPSDVGHLDSVVAAAALLKRI